MSASSQAESRGTEWNVECREHVGSLTVVVWSSCQSNLTKPLFDVVFIWTFANSVGVCGVVAVLGTAVRSAWRVWLLNHWRGVPSGSACWSWRAVGGGCDRPECLKKRIFCREFTELPGLRIPKLEGGSAEPHGGYAHRISVRRGHWLGRETSNEI